MKILLTTAENNIAPRFDLTMEVYIADIEDSRLRGEPRSVLLSGPSGDDLCSLILKENVEAVVCGGIEESHYKYLSWKKISVLDRVIGQADDILRLYIAGGLKPGLVMNAGHSEGRGGDEEP